MYKRFFIFLFCGCLFFSGCQNDTAPTPEKTGGKISVVTTIPPLYDFAYHIGLDHIELTNIIPPGEEPHDWEPTPADMILLETCDIFIYSGNGMEPWVNSVLHLFDSNKQVVLDASTNTKLIQGDPHIWLSLANARNQLTMVYSSLCQADPDNYGDFTNNFKQYIGEINQLSASYEKTLQDPYRDKIVVAHAAFGYLCNDWNLQQIPFEGLGAGSDPEPARMAEVISQVKKENIPVIFVTEHSSSKVADAISEETGVEIQTLYTMESMDITEISEGKNYTYYMNANLQALEEALNQ